MCRSSSWAERADRDDVHAIGTNESEAAPEDHGETHFKSNRAVHSRTFDLGVGPMVPAHPPLVFLAGPTVPVIASRAVARRG